MMSTTIEITCRFFGRYAEAIGVDETNLLLPTGASVGTVVDAVRERFPGGKQLPARPLAAVNRAHVLSGHVLSDGDEVALLPPLAGG